MLEAVGTPVAVRPDGRLARVAKRRGWAIEDWGGPPTPDDADAPELESGRLRRLAASAVRRVSQARARVSGKGDPPS